MHVELRDGTPEVVELNIYEPPRFFEAFLWAGHTEPPDITARICGIICPVAYQTSACNAIENACGVTLPEELVALRRLLYCGGGSTATRCTCTCCTHPTSSERRTSSPARDHRAAVGTRASRWKKAGKPPAGAHRRPGHPPGECPRRRVLPVP